MIRIKIITMFILLVFVGYGCSKQTVPFSNYMNSYFPLRVGQHHLLIYKNDYRHTVETLVKDTVSMEGDWFARVGETRRDEDVGGLRTLYFHFDSEKNVERKILHFDSLDKTNHTGKDNFQNGTFLWYKFNATLGESWNAFSNYKFYTEYSGIRDTLHFYRITLQSKTDSVMTGKTIYKDCYRFYFEDIDNPIGSYYEWLAEDIGVVKRVWGLTNQREYFLVINGQK